MKRSATPTHRLYVYYKNGNGISKVYHSISSAWFDGSQYMKNIKVSEIRIIKLKT